MRSSKKKATRELRIPTRIPTPWQPIVRVMVSSARARFGPEMWAPRLSESNLAWLRHGVGHVLAEQGEGSRAEMGWARSIGLLWEFHSSLHHLHSRECHVTPQWFWSVLHDCLLKHPFCFHWNCNLPSATNVFPIPHDFSLSSSALSTSTSKSTLSLTLTTSFQIGPGFHQVHERKQTPTPFTPHPTASRGTVKPARYLEDESKSGWYKSIKAAFFSSGNSKNRAKQANQSSRGHTSSGSSSRTSAKRGNWRPNLGTTPGFSGTNCQCVTKGTVPVNKKGNPTLRLIQKSLLHWLESLERSCLPWFRNSLSNRHLLTGNQIVWCLTCQCQSPAGSWLHWLSVTRPADPNQAPLRRARSYDRPPERGPCPPRLLPARTCPPDLSAGRSGMDVKPKLRKLVKRNNCVHIWKKAQKRLPRSGDKVTRKHLK